MWPQCLKQGVAAITYGPLMYIDLSKYPEGEPKAKWSQLEPTQKASLKRVAYEMKAGDVIYVKHGPMIVDKGIVRGPKNGGAYFFDTAHRVRMQDGKPWAHQVQVDWSSNFPEFRMLLGGEQVTVKELADHDVTKLEAMIRAAQKKSGTAPPREPAVSAPLIEESYYRETPARLKFIIPRHNKLSNAFVRWLKRRYGVSAHQEKDRIDIRFSHRGIACLAELKVCFGVGSTNPYAKRLANCSNTITIQGDAWPING